MATKGAVGGFKRLFVANRGEIAIRILRTAAEMQIPTVAVYSEDDATSLHVRLADEAVALEGKGARPYLDIEKVIAAIKAAGCDAVHPGYGFLSENAAFARRCHEEGIVFIGPEADTLEEFGDKARAVALAKSCGVPVSRSTQALDSPDEAAAFLASLGNDGKSGAMVIKAIAGGGGRGIRVVRKAEDVAKLYQRCQSEAKAAFGNGAVYAEEFVANARHVEVQIVGDGTGAASHVWERECSIQRNHQKIIEFAPSVALSDALRKRLLDAAVSMAAAVKYRGLGTFEFLVAEGAGGKAGFVFIEANPRLQVEHTVTEEITGLDLVRIQIQVIAGATLAELGLTQADIPKPRGFAMQLRINMERMGADGLVRPSSGTITAYEPPTGPGMRVDSFAYAGYTTSPSFDSLLAKLIVHSPSLGFREVSQKAYRALSEFRLEGVATNIGFLQNLLEHPEFLANRIYTGFIDEHIKTLAAPGSEDHHKRYFAGLPAAVPVTAPAVAPAATAAPTTEGRAGGKVDRSDPLAVFGYAKSGESAVAKAVPADKPVLQSAVAGPEGTTAVPAPIQGTIIAIEVAEGAAVAKGQQLMVMEAMKMEHTIQAGVSGIVRRITVALTDTVVEGHPLVFIEAGEVAASAAGSGKEVDLSHIRPDLAELLARRELLQDAARPESVARRRKTGQRTVRENVDDLFDADTFVEYYGLAIAHQHHRRTMEDLIRNTPTDGLVTGIGTVNGHLFDGPAAKCAVMAYDFTVFAGTQGDVNHKKMDRMLAQTRKARIPVVLFAEGGGGRPGDIKPPGGNTSFTLFPQMSGQAPLVGITSGYCFAGNAAVLGCCDVIIATKDSHIGMGGPAMIEGGGLGVFRPDEIGPVELQIKSGVVDVLADDEADAVRIAKQYLSYFQGPVKDWACADQRLLRGAVPEDRRRVYDIYSVIETLADTGSVLELRRGFGIGIVTALVRIEGKPFGLLANNPKHLGGAIDSDASDKGARFMQLCDTFGLPIISLCDTPGIMVGPEAEKTGLVRHSSRMLLTGANLKVPVFAIVLRKGYGIGRIAMMGGSIRLPFLTVSWPTGEYGGMNLEGAVKLAYRKELMAIEDPARRLARYEEMVAEMYTKGKALAAATELNIDDVIDPMESRRWIMMGWMATHGEYGRAGRPYVDAW